ncbi:bifunctional aspartate kinase/homoserine dehydrogenase I [Parvicella tangerina]|uniref:Bifunctional aspartokinase/homoserine dehydrogenase 1 n=1 Tax=Parvicella tangerina TaxID=2829795 RepID=A0A916JK93_9FLAO|nr:bifunctional aspartate kinase/homoserine dehydrogenase I [Parvicella tangerina]CAG5077320.1 Bifunctional aspartokinase/homoserine dehydrogenase 1 [Parvicella tangerina]
MKILKFGGKSLANGEALKNSLGIILNAHVSGKISVVVSARGDDTNKLITIANLAKQGEPFRAELIDFFQYHKIASPSLSFDLEYSAIYDILKAVQVLKVLSEDILDQILAYGELISSKVITHQLQSQGLAAITIDARNLIIAERKNGEAIVDEASSEIKTQEFFKQLNPKSIPIITGFIASDTKGETITLGRNGSNYSATLLAKFLNAEEVQNWTNINGFYTADPHLVKNAKQIDHLSYREANELAQFGANIIHPKTISPLIPNNIPIIIKNSFSPKSNGTLIDAKGSGKGIKAVNVIQDCALVSIEGKGMADKVGIDAKIFSTLSAHNISVKLISQASSERSIGFIVASKEALFVKDILEENFQVELNKNDIHRISVNENIAIIAITGRHNYALEKAISGLRKNKIWLHLITNSISGEHISLVTDKEHVRKAVNVVHNHVFGAQKTLNVFAIGKGNVGKTFINQVLQTKEDLSKKRKLGVKIVGIADSSKYIFDSLGLLEDWEKQLQLSQKKSTIDEILLELEQSDLENIVLVDNTANQEIANRYDEFIQKGFDVIASNKIANTLPFETYQNLRTRLREKHRHFLYETNVGAGLPVIDTVKHLVDADEEIHAISGVFSGSLSYLFNTFSAEDKKFSEILLDAKKKGFTEPDPREDLSGQDVARKLLILAREIGHEVNFEDIEIESLIPADLQNESSWKAFEDKLDRLDQFYSEIKSSLNGNTVLRYVGTLESDGSMRVKLEQYDTNEPLANLRGTDSLIQVFTASYGDKPIIIQGAGAGAEVTARGVYSDLIRIGNMN